MARAWVGTSGYLYRHWRGPFYPPGLPTRAWLSYYSERFPTVELNTTFYGLPDRSTVDGWREAVPEGFRFALKLSRYGTHLKRLREPSTWLDRFFDAVQPLEGRIEVVVAQLPPRWRFDPERLDGFLGSFPRDHRLAVEFRDRDWLRPETYALLQAHGAALCIHDLVERHPWVVTADHVYLRFHGPIPGRPYVGAYSPQALAAAARRIRTYVSEGRDVYAYFNNDTAGQALIDAKRLERYLRTRGDHADDGST